MAVAFDAVGPGATGIGDNPVTSLTWSHTCTGTNLLLTAGVAAGVPGTDTTVTTTVTYNGIAMTSAGKIHSNNDIHGYVELFYLVAPPTGANTVAVTANTAVALECGSVSFTGVDQSNPVAGATTSFGFSTAPSITVSSATDNMVVDAACSGSAITGSGKTSRWIQNLNGGSGAGNGAQSTAAGAGSVTMSYTAGNDWWGMVAMSVVAAPPPIVPVDVAWFTA